MVGAGGADWALSFVQRCLLAGRALWFYAGKLIWPRQLTFVYPRWQIDAVAWWQYLFPLAALAVIVALWKLRSRIGRGPLVAVLCFAGTLLPALGFVDIYPFRYSYVADHFQYLAGIALIALAVNAASVIGRRIASQGRHWGTFAGAALLLILGASTWSQAHVYRNEETLWRDTLAKNPDSWMVRYNLGVVLQERGNVTEAKELYEDALRLKPDYAEAHNNLGKILFDLNKTTEAVVQDEEAVRLKPEFAEGHYNLGIALARTGRMPEAIEQFEQAVRLKPDFAEAHYNLGLALAKTGRLPEAMEHWEQAVRLEPDFAAAHYNLGLALEHAGKNEEAISHYERALRLKPGFTDARNALARLQTHQ